MGGRIRADIENHRHAVDVRTLQMGCLDPHEIQGFDDFRLLAGRQCVLLLFATQDAALPPHFVLFAFCILILFLLILEL